MAKVKYVDVYFFIYFFFSEQNVNVNAAAAAARTHTRGRRRRRRLARFARRENKNRRGGKRWRGREIVREIEREGEKVN